jgi:small conductance mechanosensitive channel
MVKITFLKRVMLMATGKIKNILYLLLALIVGGALLVLGFIYKGTVLPYFTNNTTATILRFLFIIIGTYLGLKVVYLAINRFAVHLKKRVEEETHERIRQIDTLAGILKKIVIAVGVIIAGLMLLKEINVDIRPILTAAGIGGIALGFGAQTLVRDIIGGFFLIIENQIRIGDVVKIGDKSGLVEAINLRTVVLRDLEGVVHIIPNGSIQTISNMTKEWSRCVIDIAVAYKEDLDQVMNVLAQTGKVLQEDVQFAGYITEPIEILGVDNFADSAVIIKIMITTKPLKQWEVGRELRRRIKKAFDQHNIEIPFPHRTIYWGVGQKNN